ncbi:unnamed protein product [Blepharisma stoltei]|uniref:FHA domain-containing protein n=1 Tax=Blepharisma stoltei TaxID=1481888 RepID=A0AAU9IMR5_9CILI|nr:unnamed protein product [Blepharisma stoltei]
MNFESTLTQWLVNLSEDDPIMTAQCINSINYTCTALLNSHISDNIKVFGINILSLIQQNPGNPLIRIKLISFIATMMDFYFVNSFPLMANQFEEFLEINRCNKISKNLMEIRTGDSSNNENQRVSSDYVSRSTNEQLAIIKEVRLEDGETSALTLYQLSCPDKRRSEGLEKSYTYKFDGDWPVRIGCEKSGFRTHIPIRCSSQIILDKFHDHIIAYETSTNDPGMKIQVFTENLEEGQIYSFGETKMKVEEIDSVGNLHLSFELSNEIVYRVIDGCENGEILIGRTRINKLRFANDAKMSKEHAGIIREGKRWVIKDKNSRNGVWRYLHTLKTTGAGEDSMRCPIMNDTKFNFCEVIFQCKIKISP